MSSATPNRFAVPVALLILILCGRIAWLLSAGWRPMAAPTTAPSTMMLDPNTATWQELACLPGIGESVSKRIVAYREKQRGRAFNSAKDLDAVQGIGPRTIEELSPHLTFAIHPERLK